MPEAKSNRRRPEPRLLITEAEAARSLTLSIRVLQEMRSGEYGPPYVQLSERRIAYSPVSLQAWIRKQSVRAKAS